MVIKQKLEKILLHRESPIYAKIFRQVADYKDEKKLFLYKAIITPNRANRMLV
jgi:hypothetical protein